MQKEVSFINTSCSTAWIYLVSALKGHVIHVPILSMCVRGGKDQGCTKGSQ